jgi:hypothetical protein
VGAPEIGHPVLWRCEVCGGEQRHVVQDLVVIADKLHHEICLATEIDRRTVNRVMAEMSRYRQHTHETIPAGRPESTEGIDDVAAATAVCRELVAQISAAEADWMRRRGYVPETGPGT